MNDMIENAIGKLHFAVEVAIHRALWIFTGNI